MDNGKEPLIVIYVNVTEKDQFVRAGQSLAISFKRGNLLKTINLKLIVNKNNIFNIKF